VQDLQRSRVPHCPDCGSRRRPRARDWATLTSADTQKFFTDYAALQGSALAEQMVATVSFQTQERLTAHAGEKGEYYPLSVYQDKGYSESALKNIEKNCKSKFDAVLNEHVYKLDISEEGHKSEDIQINQRAFEPRKKRAAASDDDSDAGAKSKKGKSGKKAEDKKEANESKDVKKGKGGKNAEDAKKACAAKAKARQASMALAPVLLTLQTLMQQKLVMNFIIQRLPAYILDDAHAWHRKLAAMNDVVQRVLTEIGNEADCNDVREMKGICKEAAKFTKDLQTMVAIAEGSGAGAPSSVPSSASSMPRTPISR
jgi:hypothetical protein